MTTLNYIIVYSKSDAEDDTYFGFKLFEKQEADQYMKCIKELTDTNSTFSVGSVQEFYNADDFVKSKVSASDIKFLNKFFDLSNGDQIGIFPDAVNDAYDYGLIDDLDEETDEEDEDEEDY